MSDQDHTLDRLRQLMKSKKQSWEEKKMFGGVCFMVDDKMCFGTYKGGIMTRTDPEESEALTMMKHTEQMVQAGRTMRGFIHILPEGYDLEKDLNFWIEKCLAYNPKANKSAKRRKKTEKKEQKTEKKEQKN